MLKYEVVTTPTKFHHTKVSIYLPLVTAIRDLPEGKSLVLDLADLRHEYPATKDPIGAIYSACLNAGMRLSTRQDHYNGKVYLSRNG